MHILINIFVNIFVNILGNIIKKRILSVVLSMVLAMGFCSWVVAQETPEEIPEVESERQQLTHTEPVEVLKIEKYQLHEERVGGRLERVTVNWNNGITEVYKNGRDDTIWHSEEDSLGDRSNVRQWRVGSW